MLNPDITIRPFIPSDQDAARALILNGLGEHFGFIDETLNPDLDDITASYLVPGHIFLVAERQLQLVGTGALLFLPEATGQLVRVSTHRAHRRLGIAGAICHQLIGHARQRRLRWLIVETNRDWYDAIRLYQQLGFREEARSEQGYRFRMNLS